MISDYLMTIIKVAEAILTIVGLFKLYNKLGEPAWKSLIPIYDEYILYKRVYSVKAFIIYTLCDIVSSACLTEEYPGLVIMLLGIVTGVAVIVIQFKFAKEFAKAFGQGAGFTALTFFMPSVAYLIVGYSDKYNYLGNN